MDMANSMEDLGTRLGGAVTRRSVLKGAGALIVGVAMPGVLSGSAKAQSVAEATARPPLLPDQLDSWIKVAEDGGITAYFGKMDTGQGVDIAIGQIVAEELDVP